MSRVSHGGYIWGGTVWAIVWAFGFGGLFCRRMVVAGVGSGMMRRGEKVMPREVGCFLDWLLLGPDRVPLTQRDWAVENNIHEDSIRRIKRDARFAKEWDRRAAELNIHPERTQSVIDALHSQAAGGSVQAASLYLQYVEKFTPRRRVVVDDDREAAGLSNDELVEELEEQVRHLRVVGE